MALIDCPECGRSISDLAPACVGCGYVATRPAAAKRGNRLLLASFAAIGLVVACNMLTRGNSTSPANASRSYWTDDFNVGITRALTATSTTGCGQYRYRSVSEGNYLVACTRDGVSWVEYWVDVDTNSVLTRKPP